MATHARAADNYTAADAAVLAARLEGTDARDLLAEALAPCSRFGRVAVVSSFGAESAVLLDLVASVRPATPVLFVDTGRLFAETLSYAHDLTAFLGLSDVRWIGPDPDRLAEVDPKQLRWSYDPDGCCAVRKVAPLDAALGAFDTWITGRKRHQSATRVALPRVEADRQWLKLNPLADWAGADVAAWQAARRLPPHPLVAEGYPSIGCAPCTSKVEPGEDPRAGRWRGWDKTECGIHGNEPVF